MLTDDQRAVVEATANPEGLELLLAKSDVVRALRTYLAEQEEEA